jgi:radical SAM superfamily enzyme YgiQ (UPF0313 family)
VIEQVGSWIFSAKKSSSSISPDRNSVYSFDLEGRPISWYESGTIYKRSLNGELFGRRRLPGQKKYWRIPGEEADLLCGRLLETVASAPAAGLREPWPARLEEILRWTPAALARERDRYDLAYRPVSILPPDQYLSIVLQATSGCSWNRCTFCNFYQDRPFEVRLERDFREHVERVAALLGRGADLRRSIFLADGNALTLANSRLLPMFDLAGTAFPGRRLHGFIDLFTGERKSTDDWAELRRSGLERVCIGLESGDGELLRRLNKPGSVGAAAPFISTLKAAGLAVSIVLMVGIGGQRFAARHPQKSLDLVSRLPLTARDIVYLSPYREGSNSEERAAQYVTLRDGIRALHPKIRISRYDLLEFIY